MGTETQSPSFIRVLKHYLFTYPLWGRKLDCHLTIKSCYYLFTYPLWGRKLAYTYYTFLQADEFIYVPLMGTETLLYPPCYYFVYNLFTYPLWGRKRFLRSFENISTHLFTYPLWGRKLPCTSFYTMCIWFIYVPLMGTETHNADTNNYSLLNLFTYPLWGRKLTVSLECGAEPVRIYLRTPYGDRGFAQCGMWNVEWCPEGDIQISN